MERMIHRPLIKNPIHRLMNRVFRFTCACLGFEQVKLLPMSKNTPLENRYT